MLGQFGSATIPWGNAPPRNDYDRDCAYASSALPSSSRDTIDDDIIAA